MKKMQPLLIISLLSLFISSTSILYREEIASSHQYINRAATSSYILYETSDLSIQLDNFTIFSGSSILKFDFYSNDDQNLTDISFTLISKENAEILLNRRYTYQINYSTNKLFYLNGTYFGNCHIFKNVDILAENANDITLSNYNSQIMTGDLSFDEENNIIPIMDNTISRYSVISVKIIDQFGNHVEHKFYYDIQTGILIQQQPVILSWSFLPDLKFRACGGFSYKITESDFEFSDYESSDDSDDDQSVKFSDFMPFILLAIGGSIFYLTYHEISKRRK